MPAIASRFLGCLAVLAITNFIFPNSVTPIGMLLGTIMLLLLYTFLRPLMLVLALPFNLLLLGLVTPFADALLVRWTAAWVCGLTLTYWQALLVAILLSIAYWPYSLWRQNRLKLA